MTYGRFIVLFFLEKVGEICWPPPDEMLVLNDEMRENRSITLYQKIINNCL